MLASYNISVSISRVLCRQEETHYFLRGDISVSIISHNLVNGPWTPIDGAVPIANSNCYWELFVSNHTPRDCINSATPCMHSPASALSRQNEIATPRCALQDRPRLPHPWDRRTSREDNNTSDGSEVCARLSSIEIHVETSVPPAREGETCCNRTAGQLAGHSSYRRNSPLVINRRGSMIEACTVCASSRDNNTLF